MSCRIYQQSADLDLHWLQKIYHNTAGQGLNHCITVLQIKQKKRKLEDLGGSDDEGPSPSKYRGNQLISGL